MDACDSGSWQYGTSIALGSDDNPHIAYCSADGQDLMYASWNGSIWQHELVYTFTPAYFSGDPDLALDALDRPHIAFYSGSIAGNDLMYAWNDETGIGEGDEEVCYSLLCGPLHPNPTTGITSLQFSLAAVSYVEISLFEISGRLVERPVSGQYAAGTHAAFFLVSSPGIYLVRISSDNHSEVRRFVVIE